MLINVPQYIDVEDKVAGPLTAKQLLWMIALGIILLILWNVVSGPVFYIIAIPLALIFVALAFYKPYGQPFGSFVIFGIMYFFKPKIYVWKRTSEREVKAPVKTQTNVRQFSDKKITTQSLQELSQLLDSEGSQYNSDLESILKQKPKK